MHGFLALASFYSVAHGAFLTPAGRVSCAYGVPSGSNVEHHASSGGGFTVTHPDGSVVKHPPCRGEEGATVPDVGFKGGWQVRDACRALTTVPRFPLIRGRLPPFPVRHWVTAKVDRFTRSKISVGRKIPYTPSSVHGTCPTLLPSKEPHCRSAVPTGSRVIAQIHEADHLPLHWHAGAPTLRTLSCHAHLKCLRANGQKPAGTRAQ